MPRMRRTTSLEGPVRVLLGSSWSLGPQREKLLTQWSSYQSFRCLHDCSGCFRLERFAGWALHPLESAAFSRRTPKAAISRALPEPGVWRVLRIVSGHGTIMDLGAWLRSLGLERGIP